MAHLRVYIPKSTIFRLLKPVQKLVKHQGQKSQIQKKMPWNVWRKYPSAYSQPYCHNQVFSPNLATVLDNLRYCRMHKSPRRPKTNFYCYCKPQLTHSVTVVYRCGKNQFIWDGHSKHRNPITHKPYPIPLKYQKFFQWPDTTTRECRLHFEESKSVDNSSDNSSQNPDPSLPNKQQLHLILDYQSLKSPLMLHIMGTS